MPFLVDGIESIFYPFYWPPIFVNPIFNHRKPILHSFTNIYVIVIISEWMALICQNTSYCKVPVTMKEVDVLLNLICTDLEVILNITRHQLIDENSRSYLFLVLQQHFARAHKLTFALKVTGIIHPGYICSGNRRKYQAIHDFINKSLRLQNSSDISYWLDGHFI